MKLAQVLQGKMLNFGINYQEQKTIECFRLCALGSWREFENFMCEQLIYKFTKQPIHFVHDQQVPDVANVMFTMSYLLYVQCNDRCRLHEYSKYFHFFNE